MLQVAVLISASGYKHIYCISTTGRENYFGVGRATGGGSFVKLIKEAPEHFGNDQC
jgi:hypothetical protein